MNLDERFRGCLIGLACGDAVGTTVEFSPRGTFEPMTDMVGGGPFGLQPGEWTDDTSMALCLAASLTETGTFDPGDQMDRYCRWYRDGYMASNGRCFDIGGTVGAALTRYQKSGDPIAGSEDPHTAGNGSLMRLAPVPMLYFDDEETAVRLSGESSKTTHGAREAVEACRLFGWMLVRALAGAAKEEILRGPVPSSLGLSEPGLQPIADGAYQSKPESEIFGTGYVVAALEAALWCFYRTDDFASAILKAANLGDDADTTAAITGQIAGAFYGLEGIPPSWRARLAHYVLIEGLADDLHRNVSPERGHSEFVRY